MPYERVKDIVRLAVRRLAAISPEELAERKSAASARKRTKLAEWAATLREFATKVRATLRTKSLARIGSEFEALVQAEGLAMRAGPRRRPVPFLNPSQADATEGKHHQVKRS